MKTNLKAVYRHLDTNLNKQEKIELGLVQDGTKLARQITGSTAEMKRTFLEVLRELDNLEQVRDDTEQDYNKLEKIVKNIENINKELGITSTVPEIEEMLQALDEFNTVDGQVANILKR